MSDHRELIAAFSIAGEPISKARARFTGKGSRVRSYTPEKTMRGEENMRAHFIKAAPLHLVDDANAFAVEATFYNGTRQRRDVDNMLKLILDGLNKVAWKDDNQVTEVIGRKILATAPVARTDVSVYRLGLLERRLIPCVRCGTEFESYPSQDKRKYCTIDCYHEGLRLARMKTCQECGIEFDSFNRPVAKYCSKPCQFAGGRALFNCTVCGTTFSKQKWHAAKDGSHYCSTACQQAAIRPTKALAARGICSTCGGPTSKKQYTNCRGCSRGVNGKPIPTDSR